MSWSHVTSFAFHWPWFFTSFVCVCEMWVRPYFKYCLYDHMARGDTLVYHIHAISNARTRIHTRNNRFTSFRLISEMFEYAKLFHWFVNNDIQHSSREIPFPSIARWYTLKFRFAYWINEMRDENNRWKAAAAAWNQLDMVSHLLCVSSR